MKKRLHYYRKIHGKTAYATWGRKTNWLRLILINIQTIRKWTKLSFDVYHFSMLGLCLMGLRNLHMKNTIVIICMDSFAIDSFRKHQSTEDTTTESLHSLVLRAVSIHRIRGGSKSGSFSCDSNRISIYWQWDIFLVDTRDVEDQLMMTIWNISWGTNVGYFGLLRIPL